MKDLINDKTIKDSGFLIDELSIKIKKYSINLISELKSFSEKDKNILLRCSLGKIFWSDLFECAIQTSDTLNLKKMLKSQINNIIKTAEEIRKENLSKTTEKNDE